MPNGRAVVGLRLGGVTWPVDVWAHRRVSVGVGHTSPPVTLHFPVRKLMSEVVLPATLYIYQDFQTLMLPAATLVADGGCRVTRIG